MDNRVKPLVSLPQGMQGYKGLLMRMGPKKQQQGRRDILQRWRFCSWQLIGRGKEGRRRKKGEGRREGARKEGKKGKVLRMVSALGSWVDGGTFQQGTGLKKEQIWRWEE